jgi:hypothetical protein
MRDEKLFPHGLFQPRHDDGDPNSGCVLADLALPGGLCVIARDSEPFDKITYLIRGKPIANEYVGAYRNKFEQIKADPEVYIVALSEIRESST